MKCEKCHRQLLKKRVEEYHYQECGVTNVFLADIDVLECSSCGDRSPLIPNISDLHASIAESFALKPSLLTGAELRFIRKELKLSGREFSRLLGIDHTTLSRWENGKKSPGKPSDRLVRFFYFRYLEEVEERIMSRHIIGGIADTETRPMVAVDVTFPSHNPSLYSYSDGEGFAPA